MLSAACSALDSFSGFTYGTRMGAMPFCVWLSDIRLILCFGSQSLRDQVQAYCESTDVGNESGAGAGMQASSMESKALHQQDFASPAAMTKKLLEDVSNRVEDNKARQDTLRLQGELFNGYCLGPGRKENRQVVKKLKVHALAQQQRLAQMSTEVIHHYRILDFMCGTTFLLQSYWGELIAIGSRKVGAIPADPRLPRDKVAHKPVTEASVTDEQEAQVRPRSFYS